MINLEYVDKKDDRGLLEGILPAYPFERLRKTSKNLPEESPVVGRESNSGLLEYEEGLSGYFRSYCH
jgi:hypothetical protein